MGMAVRVWGGGQHCDNTVALSSCHSSPRWAGAIPDPIPRHWGNWGEVAVPGRVGSK